MERIKCTIDNIRFQNEENGYTVAMVTVDGEMFATAIVGSLLGVAEGCVVECEGEWETSKYGRQFKVSTWKEIVPTTVEGIKAFLGSGLIKGIGKVMAERIVQKFGEQTLAVIDRHPDRLLAVSGISQRKLDKIRESWGKHRDIRDIMVFLQGYGVSTTFTAKIYKKYGKESVKKVKENPYRLADDIVGCGFKTADEVAMRMGISREGKHRICAGLEFTLATMATDGHTFATRSELLTAASEILGTDASLISEQIALMAARKDIVEDGENYYLPMYYHAEKNAAERLLEVIGTPPTKASTPDIKAMERNYNVTYDELQAKAITESARSKVMVLTGGPGCLAANTMVTMGDGVRMPINLLEVGEEVLSYDISKKELCKKKVLNVWKRGVKPVYEIVLEDLYHIEATEDHKFYAGEWKELRQLTISDSIYIPEKDRMSRVMGIRFVGETMTYDIEVEDTHCFIANRMLTHNCGKTFTTKGIVTALKDMGMEILCAAPTGRAAKRMQESIGLPCKTIHRLLQYKPNEGFTFNENNPLKGDVLIVDECSMIDILLMNSLVKAMPRTMHLIMVGDIDQLPSVGAGNVLRDVIDSGKVAVVRLTKVFRQAAESKIVMGAHAINEGRMPDLTNAQGTDFFFIDKDEPMDIASEIVGLVKDRLPRYYGYSASDVQVLTPMRKGDVGTMNLNVLLQGALNTSTVSLKYGNTVFKVGDRVMQTKNNYNKGVFNGDMGYIEDIDNDEGTLLVRYEGITEAVEYEKGDLNELTLSYAVTIHKSQGSEFPIVVMPMTYSHYIMLQRNLIYTGVTRAKKVCVLVGQKRALAYSVRNMVVTRRNSGLKDRLRNARYVP